MNAQNEVIRKKETGAELAQSRYLHASYSLSVFLLTLENVVPIHYSCFVTCMHGILRQTPYELKVPEARQELPPKNNVRH